MRIKVTLLYESYADGARYNGSAATLIGVVDGKRYENENIPGIIVIARRFSNNSIPRRYVSVSETLEVEVPDDFKGEIFKAASTVSGTGNSDQDSWQRLFPA